MSKMIENLCELGDLQCILEVDGRYFGYDNDPAHPETFYDDIEKAHVFSNQGEALSMTSWLTGTNFKLTPFRTSALKEWEDRWNNGDTKFVSDLLDSARSIEKLALERKANNETIQPEEILSRFE